MGCLVTTARTNSRMQFGDEKLPNMAQNATTSHWLVKQRSHGTQYLTGCASLGGREWFVIGGAHYPSEMKMSVALDLSTNSAPLPEVKSSTSEYTGVRGADLEGI